MAGSAPPILAPPPTTPIAAVSPPALHPPLLEIFLHRADSRQIAMRQIPRPRRMEGGQLPHTRGSVGRERSSQAAALASTNKSKQSPFPDCGFLQAIATQHLSS